MNRKLALGVLGGAVFALATPAQAANVTLKATSCLARNHDFTQAFLQAFVEPINAKKTDLNITYLGGPEVTPFREQGGAVKRGLIDLIICPAAYYSGLFGEARLPGAQTTPVAEIRKNGAWEMMEEAWNKNLNAHLLAWVYDGGQTFYTYYVAEPKQSEKTGLDLSGLKIRSTPLYNPFLKAMGATTIVMSAGDVYAGLQRGVVTGLAWPWGSVAKYGWERFLRFRVKPKYFSASMPVIINLDKWKGLSKAQQDLLTQQGLALEKDGNAIIVKKGKEDDAKLAKAGVKDIELKGKVRSAYLGTIYGAKWAQNDKLKFTVDYKKLKPLLYTPPTN